MNGSSVSSISSTQANSRNSAASVLKPKYYKGKRGKATVVVITSKNINSLHHSENSATEMASHVLSKDEFYFFEF